MTRIVFMGTPEFAVPTLAMLADAHRVVGVVTQPDRPAGRGRRLEPSPVKLAAQARGLPLIQPHSLRTPEAMASLAAWSPDVIVVAAFGQILRQDLLDLPPHGCLNVHASLLPRWRGAAPIPAAILAGDAATGVTIMQMDAGLDTGPIVAQREEPIHLDDTRATLERRLAQLGADLLRETLPDYLAGCISPRPQPEEGVTYAPELRKEDGLLDWSRPADELARKVRAFNPWPGAFTSLRGERFRILQAAAIPDMQIDAPPGTLLPIGDGLGVATGAGVLRLQEVQLAGKRVMDIVSFLCGQRDCIGVCLDNLDSRDDTLA